MERRAAPRKTVLMSGEIRFAGSTIDCLIRDIPYRGRRSISLTLATFPERFNLVFKADGELIPCHVIGREEERIGVTFD
jgi:hypothetical protein